MIDSINAVPILMYHSISHGSDPTCISPSVFEAQLLAIAQSGRDVISLERFYDWYCGRISLERPSLVITFDDGFSDFYEHAYPGLRSHRFPATVFVPTARMGGEENWVGAASPARSLMPWPLLKALAQDQISIAPHSRTHANLAFLSGQGLQDEVVGAFEELETYLGSPSKHFAPPYGSVSPEVLDLLAATATLSVGVNFDIATRNSPLYDLPRIEMFYYQDPETLRAFLEGRGDLYFQARKWVRRLRETAFGRGRKRVMT